MAARKIRKILHAFSLFGWLWITCWGLAGCGNAAKPAASPSTAVTPNPAATQGIPRQPAEAPPSRSKLRNFYVREKYSEEERAAVDDMVEQVLTSYSEEEKRQAAAEILAYHHVVYHTTNHHDLNRNHALIRRYEARLKKICEFHQVPFLAVLAITSWENSGDMDKVSWADAAGVGQMTWGAVDTAHAYSARQAEEYYTQARFFKNVAKSNKDPEARRKAAQYMALAERYDLVKRHRHLAHQAGVEDERLVVDANLEDAVVFFKFLLDKYGDRVDLAISAYHNGVLNNDDIIFDYLSRRDPNLMRPTAESRANFLTALGTYKVNFLTIWNDLRCRQMLNGLRTVEGEITENVNRHMALGDESDIYVWKVLGSLAGYLAGSEFTRSTVAKYDANRDFVEVVGVTSHLTVEDFREGVRKGELVRVTAPIADHGVGGETRRGSDPRLFSYYISPELDGYLWSLTLRMREATGRKDFRLPVKRLSMAHLTATGKQSFDWRDELHLKGVAAEIPLGMLNDSERAVLRQTVEADYLMDRIYKVELEGGRLRVCVNPRWGEDFLAVRDRNLSAQKPPGGPKEN
ncbi:hypothetical protein DYH09_11740 [bacterium CPR1]|nr:hypothetical protein [bacterium CPR1]